jgi:hypothetical protein
MHLHARPGSSLGSLFSDYSRPSLLSFRHRRPHARARRDSKSPRYPEPSGLATSEECPNRSVGEVDGHEHGCVCARVRVLVEAMASSSPPSSTCLEESGVCRSRTSKASRVPLPVGVRPGDDGHLYAPVDWGVGGVGDVGDVGEAGDHDGGGVRKGPDTNVYVGSRGKARVAVIQTSVFLVVLFQHVCATVDVPVHALHHDWVRNQVQ